MSFNEEPDRRRDARHRLNQQVAAVKLNSQQPKWVNPDVAQVLPITDSEGMCYYTHTFQVPNAQKFGDVTNGEHEDHPSFGAMLYGMAQACNHGAQGITPKRLKSVKHNLDPLNLELTDKDCAVTIYHEIISLPRALLKPGELCRSAPNDSYLRVWVFAQPYEGCVNEDVNFEPLDLAVKLNVIWASIAQQKMKGATSKKTKQKFQSTYEPQFVLDKMTSMHKWIEVAKNCVILPETTRQVVPTTKNMGIYHPWLFLNMSSPVFTTPLPARTGVSENVQRARLKTQARVQNPANYETGGAQPTFAPHNPESFFKLDSSGMMGMSQMWQVGVSDKMTPNRVLETNPAMLVATPCYVKLQARTRHETLLGELKRHPLFFDAHFHTQHEEWLVLRRGAEVHKRQCCGLGSGTRRKLFDCLHETVSETVLPEDGPRNVLNCSCKFEHYDSYDEFLRAVLAWDGDPEGEMVPLHIMQMNPATGKMEAFVHPDYLHVDDDDDVLDAQETAPAVVALLPHHMDWSNREILEWTMKVLSRSNFSPKPAFVVDTLQGGKSRRTVEEEYETQRKEQRRYNRNTPKAKRRKKLPLLHTLPLSADAEEVTFAVHFALPDNAGARARDAKLEMYCLGAAVDSASHEDARDEPVPLFFEKLPAAYKLPHIADGQYVCEEQMLESRPSFQVSQDVFVRHLVETMASPYSVGPDHTRAEPQTTTLARIAFDELRAQYGEETAMLKAGENYAVHVVTSTHQNFHTEQTCKWIVNNMERTPDGDLVAKKTTEFPKLCRGDPDFYVEDALEAMKQQWFVQKGVFRNHFLTHMLWANMLTAFVEVESNEMKNENPCGAIAIVARPGWGKSYMGAVLMALIGPEHFTQAANRSATAGQGVSRDTGEGLINWNDEFAFYMNEAENALMKTWISMGILKRKRTVTRQGADGGQEYAEDNLANRNTQSWNVCLNKKPDAKRDTEDQKALQDRFFTYEGDDKEEHIEDEGDTETAGYTCGHKVSKCEDETTRMNSKSSAEELQMQRTETQVRNHVMRVVHIEKFLASIGAKVVRAFPASLFCL